ncbi:MAG: SpoIIE family protein phosphatase [Hyphomicrobiales bacterium]|nr:SpoIIE family protein phosphatase [Hyphomicrobiales bacterium]MCP5370196.1 SpoIIE family protein phosphatase [Hyphomicrobiales bacterium]
MRIRSKLPLVVVVGALVTGLAFGSLNYYLFAQEIRRNTVAKLEALRDTRLAALSASLSNTDRTLNVLAQILAVKNALFELEAAWDEFRGTADRRRDLLRQTYTLAAPDGLPDRIAGLNDHGLGFYARVHHRVQPWFRTIQRDLGFYDLFLISLSGDVLYSTIKEPDYATNLYEGKWRNSGLGRVFRAVQSAERPQTRFEDFSHYAPSGAAPAAFLAAPIVDGGDLVGVLAIQMTSERLTRIMQVTTGMGKTGETYLVGSDRLMRTDSRFKAESTILRLRVDTDPVRRAFADAGGTMEAVDYRGTPVLSSFLPFDFLGTRWALLAEIDIGEVETPLREMRDNMLVVGCLLAALVIVVGSEMARRLTRPLTRLSDALTQFGRTRVAAAMPETSRNDEIGDMARVFEQVTREVQDHIENQARIEAALRESEARLLSILETSPIGVAIISADDGTVQYVNDRTLELFGMPREAALGATTGDFWADPAQREAIGREMARTGVVRDAEVQMRIPGGGSFWALYTGFSFTFGDRPARIGWLYDITERRKAAEALARAMELISGSIEYASRIQRSILPDPAVLESVLAEHAVIWEPRDVVGGDIYWAATWGGGLLLGLADCTGHGVPGAFVTLLATGALDRAQDEVAVGDPALLIGRMHQMVKATLGQHSDHGQSDDGLELGFCFLDPARRALTFAGARFSLFVVDGDGPREIKGDGRGIGYRGIPMDQTFANHDVPVAPGATYFLTTDGLIDQIGGPKRRSFGKRRFMDLLRAQAGRPLTAQRQAILDALADHQGDEPRRDDLSVVAFRL